MGIDSYDTQSRALSSFGMGSLVDFQQRRSWRGSSLFDRRELLTITECPTDAASVTSEATLPTAASCCRGVRCATTEDIPKKTAAAPTTTVAWSSRVSSTSVIPSCIARLTDVVLWSQRSGPLQRRCRLVSRWDQMPCRWTFDANKGVMSWTAPTYLFCFHTSHLFSDSC
jgi:hypothetical protein